uniref:Peptidase M32 carboxypeptidase Taq metallopeptidase n=1 Tax=Heterosigma akashiwo TaxID=2829 RepID=A0A6S9ISS3_HETAK|mmetsp:Transcript_26005/g.40914  ORF Transcript_26005/g.40914 Transcript_26005/m.40914 type:complete len:300 (-) Transcript_26005:307-1206(-)
MCSSDKSEALCRELSEAIGFDFGSGRMDVSLHPFTGGPHPTDVRITTRYSTENWKDGVTGAVHEVGHALYEQGRNKAHADLPVARALSMGVHESQSLLWERMVFLSRPFWDYATPIFHKHFPHTKDCTADDFYAVMNQVEPGFIRVDADEVTYPLHVVLRYELEKKLFDGSLDIEGVPEAWDAQMKELLGLEVDGPARGCLQDIHWSIGAFGYFPSYSLGAMMAAQIYAAAQRELPGLEDDIRQGQFAGLKTWLNEKVHQKGSLVASPDELLKEITGAALDPTIFLDYLRTKYTALYGL